MTGIKRYGWEISLLLLLVAEILLFGMGNPRMLDANVLLFSTSDFICIGLVALPLTLVIVSGGMDISFGATIGLSSIVLGILNQAGVPMIAAIPLTLLTGALCGLVNALLILFTGINPLVITLGTMYLFGGCACCSPGFPVPAALRGSAASRWPLPILPIRICTAFRFR